MTTEQKHTFPYSNVVVSTADSQLTEFAQELAARLGVAFLSAEETHDHDGLILQMDQEGLSLIDGEMVLHGDFVKMYPRIIPGKLQKELVVKAAKVKGIEGTPTAIDATAGMGQDGLLLAAIGFEVTLYERDPIIAALLQDSIDRVRDDKYLAPIVARMTVVEGDSVKAMQEMEESPDVILLDPMFPERKKSASVKKKFQIIHQLEKPCEDEEVMLQAALKAHPKKIVIKRPAKGPHLGGIKPSYSLDSKGVRYDCIVLPPKK